MSRFRVLVAGCGLLSALALAYFLIVPDRSADSYFEDAAPVFDEFSGETLEMYFAARDADPGAYIAEISPLLTTDEPEDAKGTGRSRLRVSRYDIGDLSRGVELTEKALEKDLGALTRSDAPPFVSSVGRGKTATDARKLASEYIASVEELASYSSGVVDFQLLLIDSALPLFNELAAAGPVIRRTASRTKSLAILDDVDRAFEESIEAVEQAEAPEGYEDFKGLTISTLRLVAAAYRELGDQLDGGNFGTSVRAGLGESLDDLIDEAIEARREDPLDDKARRVGKLREELEAVFDAEAGE